jgi:hypothetical protein
MAQLFDRLDETRRLITWCKAQVRPFYAQHKGQDAAERLDAEVAELETALTAVNQELAVCFLGSAGVGKSTLINALVAGDKVILPAGGIGPLTAQALNVRYADDRHFEVKYHSVQKLSRLTFGLQRMYEAELRATGAGVPPRLEVDAESAAEIQAGTESDDLRQRKKLEFRKTAQLLVTGNQNGETDVPYLLDRLYEAAGSAAAAYGTTAVSADANRVRQIAEAFEVSREGLTGVFRAEFGENEFQKSLSAHASGFLAPLILELNLYWNSDLLRDGISLVDLPGIGIANDVYRDVADTWVRRQANAVVLVVDRSGVTESAAELLRTTGYLNRLLWSSADPRGDPILMVAVVQIDKLAEEQYAQDRNRKKAEYFREISGSFESLIRGQIREQLEQVWRSESGTSVEKQKVFDNILSTLQVYALSAIQYRRILCQDEDDPAFLKSVEQTNVPAFSAGIRSIAARRQSDRTAAMWEMAVRLYHRIKTATVLVQAEWKREDRAVAEAERLREDVTSFLMPLREELRTRQGQYREFLKETVPQQIATLVSTAQNRARKDILAYLRKLDDAHYTILKAAVVKGGTHFGKRQIDLPRDFGLKFEEPIAEVWGREVLAKIRQRTKQFADDCVALVEQVVSWAQDQGARVQPLVLQAQRDAIRADAKNLAAVGREKVIELGEQVKNSLIKEIEGPIRRKCKAFVDRNEHVGAGVRDRILELFGVLAEEVTEAAAIPATAILTKLYEGVRGEIDAVFGKWQDPLQAAAEAIVSTHENFLKRSDPQRRKRILTAVEAVLNTRPADVFDAALSDEVDGNHDEVTVATTRKDGPAGSDKIQASKLASIKELADGGTGGAK